MQLIIISGRSGSGKSISLRLLEDFGYYCVDNIPISLLTTLMQQLTKKHKYIAVGIDARNFDCAFEELQNILASLKSQDNQIAIVYLDADDASLINRFNETRRKHPLISANLSLSAALEKETQLLQPIANTADLTLNTKGLSIHQLRDKLRKKLLGNSKQDFSILFQSFGFKHGITLDADYVFDARCIPNPYWLPELKYLNGLDQNVAKFLAQQQQTADFITSISSFLNNWIPRIILNNRNYLTVGIGCTGGKHRSVYLAQELYLYFKPNNYLTQIHHRDIKLT